MVWSVKCLDGFCVYFNTQVFTSQDIIDGLECMNYSLNALHIICVQNRQAYVFISWRQNPLLQCICCIWSIMYYWALLIMATQNHFHCSMFGSSLGFWNLYSLTIGLETKSTITRNRQITIQFTQQPLQSHMKWKLQPSWKCLADSWITFALIVCFACIQQLAFCTVADNIWSVVIYSQLCIFTAWKWHKSFWSILQDLFILPLQNNAPIFLRRKSVQNYSARRSRQSSMLRNKSSRLRVPQLGEGNKCVMTCQKISNSPNRVVKQSKWLKWKCLFTEATLNLPTVCRISLIISLLVKWMILNARQKSWHLDTGHPGSSCFFVI